MLSPHRILLLGLGFVLGLSSLSCADEEDQNCVAGQACVCESDCDLACESEDGGCAFECQAGVACEVGCDGGGCSFDCDGDSCILDCAGDGCSMTCNPDATTCELRNCGSGCSLACNGAATCESSCDLAQGCSVTP